MQRDKITGVVQALTLTWYLYVSSFKIKYWLLLRDVPATKMFWLCIPVSDFCIELFYRFVYIQISHVQRKHKIKSDEFMYVVRILGHKKGIVNRLKKI